MPIFLPPVSALLRNASRLRSPAIVVFIVLCAGQCQSQFRPPQVDITDQDTVNYSFFNADKNEIENREYLEPLFKKMYRQRTEGGQKISIVHLGDSHILGSFLTSEIRMRLQREFGDAGRGLVFPYVLAGTSGPKDYEVNTDSRWYGTNCQRSLEQATPFGISGFILETFNSDGRLDLRLRDTTAAAQNSQFTKITLFHRKDQKNNFDFEVRDDVTHQTAVLYLEDDFFQSYYFNQPVTQAGIFFKRKDPDSKGSLMLDGILLENELAGVVYHSIGVNGAKFSDFARARYFARELADLNPDLVILSFGTNEAQGRMSSRYLSDQIETLVSQIRQYAPNAYFLFTTPADSYLRGRGLNPYMGSVAEVIRQYARDKNYAVWDLFQLSGGDKSAQNWKSSGLMSSDSVHYSRSGYTVQGKYFYQSFIKAYNEFVHRTLEN